MKRYVKVEENVYCSIHGCVHEEYPDPYDEYTIGYDENGNPECFPSGGCSESWQSVYILSEVTS